MRQIKACRQFISTKIVLLITQGLIKKVDWFIPTMVMGGRKHLDNQRDLPVGVTARLPMPQR